jgi:hypothetical protein
MDDKDDLERIKRDLQQIIWFAEELKRLYSEPNGYIVSGHAATLTTLSQTVGREIVEWENNHASI